MTKTAEQKPGNVVYHEYLKLFLNYLLVFSVFLYLNHIGVPELIQVIIAEKKGVPYSFKPSFFSTTGTTSPYITQDFETNFDDNNFMSSYVCNKSHSYQLKVLTRDPLIFYLTSFLAPGEAEHLKAIASPLMVKSPVVGKEKYHHGRTSSNAFLSKKHDKVVACIEERASFLTQKPVENLEPLQVVWYKDGQEYQPHYDYFPPNSDGYEKEIQRGGQRIITIFAYLNTVPEEFGGHTEFPNVGIKVAAKKNDAAFWYDVNIDGTEDLRTLHGGSAVNDYEKYGLNIWIREREFK